MQFHSRLVWTQGVHCILVLTRIPTMASEDLSVKVETDVEMNGTKTTLRSVVSRNSKAVET